MTETTAEIVDGVMADPKLARTMVEYAIGAAMSLAHLHHEIKHGFIRELAKLNNSLPVTVRFEEVITEMCEMTHGPAMKHVDPVVKRICEAIDREEAKTAPPKPKIVSLAGRKKKEKP